MFPILLKLGPLTIRTYGVLIAIGLFVALRYISVQGRRENISEDSIMDMGLYIIVAGLLGARAAYVAQNWQYYSSNITAIFKIWEGGLVFYGGFIAGLVAALIYLRAHREINLWVCPGIGPCAKLWQDRVFFRGLLLRLGLRFAVGGNI